MGFQKGVLMDHFLATIVALVGSTAITFKQAVNFSGKLAKPIVHDAVGINVIGVWMGSWTKSVFRRT